MVDGPVLCMRIYLDVIGLYFRLKLIYHQQLLYRSVGPIAYSICWQKSSALDKVVQKYKKWYCTIKSNTSTFGQATLYHNRQKCMDFWHQRKNVIKYFHSRHLVYV